MGAILLLLFGNSGGVVNTLQSASNFSIPTDDSLVIFESEGLEIYASD